MSTLLELTSEYALLKNIIDDQTLSDQQVDEILDARLADLKTDTQNKVGAYVGLIKEFELAALTQKAMSEAIKKRAEQNDRKAQRIKDKLQWALEAAKLNKVETVYGSVSFWGTNLPGALEIDSVDEIPDNFVEVVTVKKPKKDAIKKAIVDGEVVPGVTLHPRKKTLKLGEKIVYVKPGIADTASGEDAAE